MTDAGPVIERRPEVDFVDDKAGILLHVAAIWKLLSESRSMTVNAASAVPV